jgi:hypothetical protein
MQSLATMATGSTNKQFLATWCGGGERSDLRIPRGSDSHRKGAFSDLGTHPPRIIPGLELMWPEQMYRSGRQVAPNPHLALTRSFTTSHRDTGCSIAELHSAHARVRVVGIYPGKHLPRPPSGETSGTGDTRIISERAGAREVREEGPKAFLNNVLGAPLVAGVAEKTGAHEGRQPTSPHDGLPHSTHVQPTDSRCAPHKQNARSLVPKRSGMFRPGDILRANPWFR